MWVDANVFNKINKSTYNFYKKELQDYNFVRFEKVSKAIDFNKDKKNGLNFKLCYPIISGRLAEDFFNEYVKATEDYGIIAATSIYCYLQSEHEKKSLF